MGTDGETFRQIFFLDCNGVRQSELGGSEIPNALDPSPHHQFGGFLGCGLRNRQYAQPDFAAPDKWHQLVNGLHFAVVNPLWISRTGKDATGHHLRSAGGLPALQYYDWTWRWSQVGAEANGIEFTQVFGASADG